MWIFTKYGFFSGTCPKADVESIQIRGRIKNHLQNLKDRFPTLADVEILENEGTDYQFRMYVPKEVWAQMLYEMAMETDYHNFKNEVADAMGKKDDYCQSLMEVWNTMYELQLANNPPDYPTFLHLWLKD